MSLDTFIPTELTIAPNPLGLAYNLKLKTIPVDAYSSFELWSPISAATLLPEEAALLQSDRLRLEEIGAKLTWLLNASCINEEAPWVGCAVNCWQDVISVIEARGFRVDAIDVAHQPQTISQTYSVDSPFSRWTIQPNCWKFTFLELKFTQQGFEPKVLPLSLLITLGQPIIKTVENVAA